MKNFSLILLTFSLALISCSSGSGEYTAEEQIREDVEWLSSDEMDGRLAGTEQEAIAANYIADRFLQLGLTPAGDQDTYFQQFTLNGPMTQSMGVENHLSRNVVAISEGSTQPSQFIILGAHYDGQGHGSIISMNLDQPDSTHFSADDNASGVAGLLHLAEKLSENPIEKSVMFIAFSGEELGLLGSRYFTERLDVPSDSILAMINFDMIGRLNNESELTIFGTETSPKWDQILSEIESNDLNIIQNGSGTGASDHVSFHDIGIPVLHFFTGTHDDYHTPGDTPDKINEQGILTLTEYAELLVRKLDELEATAMEFSEKAPQQQSVMSGDSVTMGVVPDYNFSGNGFRLDGVRTGGPADRAGMQTGDIVMQMGEIPVSNIYAYMDALGEFSPGEEIVVKVRRSGEIIELSLTF
jgi:hypothetical protein